ncbi:hypothetical protein [Sphingomonas sp.]|uniref:hypothetical protein n=1 Tax=Sphingomonas sp. TaxID=28214 RepID=UPI002EDB6152
MIVRNGWLLAGGVASAFASAAHLACILGGPAWYRAMGAPEGYARAAGRGMWTPALVTIGIAALLALWAAYAVSGAGLIGRLPLLRYGLIAIATVYLLRGLILFAPSLLRRPDLSAGFILWSSVIVLAIGLIHAVGLWRGWNDL